MHWFQYPDAVKDEKSLEIIGLFGRASHRYQKTAYPFCFRNVVRAAFGCHTVDEIK